MKLRSLLILAATMLFSVIVTAKPNNAPEGITVMSFNIRVSSVNDGANSWQYRYPTSALMILDQQPDIIGIQEALPEQAYYLKGSLAKKYNLIGTIKEGSMIKSKHMEMLYNKKTLSLLKWGTFWLSETPDKESKGWDAAYLRTATWALMKDKNSGNRFYVVNTHLDNEGKEARKKGLELIISRMSEINDSNLPIVLVGDFNMEVSDPAMEPAKQNLRNARTNAVKTDNHFSYNGWGKASDTIDFIWYSGFSSCTEFETITKQYGERYFISDHFPIKAHLIF